MESYDSLTWPVKLKRLRKVAMAALEHYDLDVRQMSHLASLTNTLFKLKTDWKDWVLRVCAPHWRTDLDLRSEILWLNALKSAGINTPVPLLTRNGETHVIIKIPEISIPLRCLIVSYQPGKLLGDQLTDTNLYKMGILFAKLHAFSTSFTAPPEFTTLKMDRILSRGEPNALFSGEKKLSREVWEVIPQVVDSVFQAYCRRYSDLSDLRVIHHDLHHDNITVYRGKLYPLDFEDTVWGFPVQDIAMAMLDLMEVVSEDEYGWLLEAFRAGYTSLLSWPEQYKGEMQAFQAGRMLWVANYVAGFEKKNLQAHMKWLTHSFKYYLKSGHLRHFPKKGD